MKRIALLLLACLFLCPTFALAEEIDFHWDLQLLHWETAESLEATEAITRYDGSVNNATHEDAPAEGCVYLLVEMSIAKTEAGGEGFQWEKLFAVDAEGNQYSRMENDTFLETYSFKRLPATDIRIGNKTGFVAFEVPAETAAEDFTFIYTLSDTTILTITQTEESTEE